MKCGETDHRALKEKVPVSGDNNVTMNISDVNVGGNWTQVFGKSTVFEAQL